MSAPDVPSAVAEGADRPVPGTGAEDDAVAFCHDLLRIDTSNYGDDDGPGERSAAEYVATVLTEAGLDVELIEPRRGRTTVMARWAGRDPTRSGLLVHAHTDVVPAEPGDWRHHPFSGELADGCLWGRGAVDMKYFVAQVLAVVGARQREERPPARDVVLAFVAD
ncbi:M20/M25/M40 family metallo-hydrolase, partial [Actinomadura adrarensis]